MNEAERKKLWDEYEKEKSLEIREKLIIEYAPLVKLVAGRLSMYLGYNVEYEDLVSYGIFGLIDAIDKFDCGKAVKFETYASLRIRGSILDQIRKMDWIPRTLRQKQKRMDAAVRSVELLKGRSATDSELAAELQITEEELAEWQSQMKITNLISLNEFLEQGSEIPVEYNHASRFAHPEKEIEEKELREKLADSLLVLTEKEKKVIILYYYEELTLKEISKVLEVSESRISQLHTKALKKMKNVMGSYMSLFTP